MKTFKEFVSLCEESDDKSKALGFQATIRRQHPDGRIDRNRKLTDAEKRRKSEKIGPDGERLPTNYRFRADATKQRQADTRVQQPEQERGSAALSPKESQRKAYLERKAREAGGAEKPKDLVKQATKILSKTKPAEVDKRPKDQPKRPAKRKVRVGPEYEGLTPREADKIYKRKIKSAGRELLKSINPRIKDDEQSKKARS